MKTLNQIKSVLVKQKKELKKKYKVKELGIFGSYARGEQKKTSDIDILVIFTPKASLFDYVGLGDFLEARLNMKVDIVSQGGIRPEFKENILKEVIMV